MDEFNNVIIEQEDGKSIEYEVLAVFEVEESNYIALLPLDNSNEITFFGCTENETTKELTLTVIEDDVEFNIVSNMFIKLMEDYVENGI